MAKAQLAKTDTGLVKGLGLLDATTIVMGSMIGSGIFIVAADIARQVQSPGLLLMTWVITAVLTIIAALSYGELAAAMPHAGGQYVYLREAFGPMWGFLYGWTLFLVIQTGTVAAVAVAFAKYTGVFFPIDFCRQLGPAVRQHPADSGYQHSCAPDMGKYSRPANRIDRAECVHVCEDRCAPRTHRLRLSCRAE